MPIPVAIETRSARIERLRIAVPRRDGRFRLDLAGGECVQGRAEALDGVGAPLADLAALAQRGDQAALGLYRLDDGSVWLHWAVGDDGRGLVPPTLAAMRAHAARGLRRWLPLLLAAMAASALALWKLMDGVGWALLLPLVLIAAMLAAMAVLGHAATLYRIRRDHRVAAASERALAEALRRGRTPRGRQARSDASAAPPLPPPRAARVRDPAAPARPGDPPLRRWQGALTGLEMQEERRGGGDARRDFGVYRFRIGAQAFALHASRALGAHEPFLAEGDRVELIAHAEPATAAGEALVYALHSLEDGQRYVAHALFFADGDAASMVRLSWTGLRRWLRLIAAVAAGTLALLGGLGLWIGGDESRWLIGIAGACSLALLLVPLACFAFSRWRWRARGTPHGRRQATTQRVYAAMDLGPPWAWRLPADTVEV